MEKRNTKAESNLEPGSKLGPFRILRHLATGGMGAVYEAIDDASGRKVALKTIAPSLVRDPVQLQRFQREARIASKLKHPNIVRVYATGSHAGIFFIAFEYVDGVPLSVPMANGIIPTAKALYWMKGILDGIAVAHNAGIVHRDIKPDNIMVMADDAVKITDFGLAKSLIDRNQAKLTAAGIIIGTPDYLAPELILGLYTPSVRSDIYSLGILLFELLTGADPYGDIRTLEKLQYICYEPIKPPRKLNPAISVGMEKCIQRMCQKDPSDRPRDIAELERLLAADAEWPRKAEKLAA